MSGNWDLPEPVRVIADLIGRDKALFLVGSKLHWDRPSRREGYLYVPKRLKPGHEIARLIGEDAAQRLVSEFSGMILPVSPCKAVIQRWRDCEVVRMARAGMRTDDIAAIVGVTPRLVRGIRAAWGVAA